MKAFLFAVALAFSMQVCAERLDDACVSFYTQGPDRYSDGTTVLDGECYALVWSGDGVFDGFTANGECIDTNDAVVLVAPVAKDGRCPRVLFQFPSSGREKAQHGRYAVYLLDTRVVEGSVAVPKGAVDGKPEIVNGYGEVSALLRLKNASEQVSAKEPSRSEPGQVAGILSAADGSSRQPRIKSMRVDGDVVNIVVEDVEGYMRVHSGKNPGAFDATGPATKASGKDGEVILTVPKTGSSGFFKVISN